MEESRISTCVCGDQEIMCIWTKKLISVCGGGGGGDQDINTCVVCVGGDQENNICACGDQQINICLCGDQEINT